jgi:hypothetical protein
MMPVRICARRLGPLRNDAATVTSCKNTRRCQLPSAIRKPGRICEKPAPGIRSANGGHGMRHAPAAAGATVRYRSLQWSQNQRPSQLTIQTKSSAAHQHRLPPVQPPPSESLQLGLFPASRLHHVLMGAHIGLRCNSKMYATKHNLKAHETDAACQRSAHEAPRPSDPGLTLPQAAPGCHCLSDSPVAQSLRTCLCSGTQGSIQPVTLAKCRWQMLPVLTASALAGWAGHFRALVRGRVPHVLTSAQEAPRSGAEGVRVGQ